jgi:hypothetical protein
LQSRTVAEGQGNLNILIKFSEYRNHPVKSEAFEFRVSNSGKFRMGYAGQSNIRADLGDIEDAENIASMPQINFKKAALNAFERFGLVRFAALASIVRAFDISS